MQYVLKTLLYYLIFINLLACVVCILDKNRAKNHKWRIKESTLFTVAILGGSVGMYITMRIIRHKTLHKRFMIGIPIIIIAQIFLIILLTKGIL